MITVERARQLYADTDPTHDFDHIQRVVNLAHRIATEEGANLETVRVAALLHDIGRPDELEKHIDHAVISGREARKILAESPADFVDSVIHAIEAHRFRNNIEPQTLEAKVLFDADKLDAIGAIGIGRAFAYAGTHGSRLTGEQPGDTPPDSPDYTPYHEYWYKLRHIKDRLYTDTGQRIAQERHAFMVAFFKRLDQEVEGKL